MGENKKLFLWGKAIKKGLIRLIELWSNSSTKNRMKDVDEELTLT